jgi:amino acid transporter
LIDITVIIYFIPFLYMFAAVMKLAGRTDRAENKHAVLIPGGKLGVYFTAGLAGAVTFASIIFSIIPPGDSSNKVLFEVKVVGASIVAIAGGLLLYWRGARSKEREITSLG